MASVILDSTAALASVIGGGRCCHRWLTAIMGQAMPSCQHHNPVDLTGVTDDLPTEANAVELTT